MIPGNKEYVFFQAGDVRLEGMLLPSSGSPGAVICHPHPLYGGSMHNKVVHAATRAFNDAGYTTLCFNFRGVGKSSGQYGEGIEERKDVVAACGYLREECKVGKIVVAGYSFGAWVASHAVSETPADGLLLIAPPVAMLETHFDHLALPFWIIYGENDPYCPGSMLQPLLHGAGNLQELRMVSGADHFFMGRESSITESIDRWFSVKDMSERNKQTHDL